MGTRTMGSHRKSDVSYNLTLDEVQNQFGDLGKPLKSMNLKNVATADNINREGDDSSMVNRQSSLSKQTVDELWQDIQHGLKKMDSVGSSSGSGFDIDEIDRKSKRETEPTLGEMTLEDFLAKAGIDANCSSEKKESVVMPEQVKQQQQPQWMQYQIPPFQQQHVFMSGQHQAQQAVMDVDFSEVKMKMCPTPLMGILSDTQTQTPGRKRHASGDVVEKTVERRQKRMIKNRESAARSRARKQAYTNELENKVSQLEEENERLKREQEIENALPFVPLSEPKYQLRRTSSM